MSKSLFFLFVLINTGLAQNDAYRYALNGGILAKKDFSDTIPFIKQSQSLIVISIKIQDSLVNFLYDTGAGASVINVDVLKKIPTKTIGNLNISDGQGASQFLEIVEYTNIKIGNLEIINMPFVVSDMTQNFDGISGILGANVISKLNWYINYDASTIFFTDKENNLPESEVISKINVGYDESNIPFATLKAGNTVLGNCKFDFGFSMGLNIPKKVFSTLQIDDIISYKYQTLRTSLLANSSTDTVSMIYVNNFFSLGKYTVPNVEVYVSDLDFCLVGQAFFAQYNIGIDSKNSHYIFYRRKISDTILGNFACFPIVFNWSKKKVIVSLIRLCSSVDNYDIKIGDEIEIINDKAVNDFQTEISFKEWYQSQDMLKIKFKKHEKSISLKREKMVSSQDCGK